MPLRMNIMTPQRRVYSEDVDMVIAPGIDGQLGILPHHAPMLTALTCGELRVKRGDEEESFVIGGGFLEVHPGWVTVLAYAPGRAGAGRRQTAEQLRARTRENVDFARAEAVLRRAMMRVKVAKLRRRKGSLRAEVR